VIITGNDSDSECRELPASIPGELNAVAVAYILKANNITILESNFSFSNVRQFRFVYISLFESSCTISYDLFPSKI
jgi:hypothetical protein